MTWWETSLCVIAGLCLLWVGRAILIWRLKTPS
jgi:hypothetical protein